MDMEAEIATIRQRYTDKIENLQSVLSIARRQAERRQPSAQTSSNSIARAQANQGTLIMEQSAPQ